MKKNGFTLAEVLITLAIIGVVAALTIPNLTLSTLASQSQTSLKKFISTMEEVNQLANAQHGYDFATMNTSGGDAASGDFYAIMRQFTSATCNEGVCSFKDGSTYTGNNQGGTFDFNGATKGPNLDTTEIKTNDRWTITLNAQGVSGNALVNQVLEGSLELR